MVLDIQYVNSKQDDNQRLEEGEDEEAEEIADDDIQARDGRRHQAFHGALRAFP
ncbi:hypothetical protein ES703_80736 [subsurface metagenome]